MNKQPEILTCTAADGTAISSVCLVTNTMMILHFCTSHVLPRKAFLCLFLSSISLVDQQFLSRSLPIRSTVALSFAVRRR